MLKKKLLKIMTIGLISTSIFTLNSIGANAQWKQNSKGWWYEKNDGSYYKNEWLNDGGKWYYFDNNGYMVHDTTINGYYLNSNGEWEEKSKVSSNKNKIHIIDEGVDKNSLEYKAYYSLLNNDEELNKIYPIEKFHNIRNCQIIDLNNDGRLELVLHDVMGAGRDVGNLVFLGYKNNQVYLIQKMKGDGEDFNTLVRLSKDKETFLVKLHDEQCIFGYDKNKEQFVIKHIITTSPPANFKMDSNIITKQEYYNILAQYNESYAEFLK